MLLATHSLKNLLCEKYSALNLHSICLHHILALILLKWKLFHIFLKLSVIKGLIRCKKGLNSDSNPELCDAGAVLHQLSYQANWELIFLWVDYKPVDVEVDDDNTRIFPGRALHQHCRGQGSNPH